MNNYKHDFLIMTPFALLIVAGAAFSLYIYGERDLIDLRKAERSESVIGYAYDHNKNNIRDDVEFNIEEEYKYKIFKPYAFNLALNYNNIFILNKKLTPNLNKDSIVKIKLNKILDEDEINEKYIYPIIRNQHCIMSLNGTDLDVAFIEKITFNDTKRQSIQDWFNENYDLKKVVIPSKEFYCNLHKK